MIKTKMGQAKHLGKHEAAAQMARLVVEMREALEEQGLLDPTDVERFDGVLHTFLAQQPKLVREEVRQG